MMDETVRMDGAAFKEILGKEEKKSIGPQPILTHRKKWEMGSTRKQQV